MDTRCIVGRSQTCGEDELETAKAASRYEQAALAQRLDLATQKVRQAKTQRKAMKVSDVEEVAKASLKKDPLSPTNDLERAAWVASGGSSVNPTVRGGASGSHAQRRSARAGRGALSTHPHCLPPTMNREMRWQRPRPVLASPAPNVAVGGA